MNRDRLPQSEEKNLNYSKDTNILPSEGHADQQDCDNPGLGKSRPPSERQQEEGEIVHEAVLSYICMLYTVRGQS
jgi:hypothetical protein